MSAVYDHRSELRLQRLIERAHRLGPGPMLHLLREIEAGADLERSLQRYADLPVEFVISIGGEGFPDRVRLVQGGCA